MSCKTGRTDELRHEKTRSNTNQAVQSQKNARDSKFRKQRDCTTCVAKTKALISCTVTMQLICTFLFEYAKSRFSHDAAQIRCVFGY